jgi:hypothetical protein
MAASETSSLRASRKRYGARALQHAPSFTGGPHDTIAGSTLSLALICAVSSRAEAQSSSPAAYLTFDEGTGTVAADASGNGHAATLFGGSGWTGALVGASALTVPGANGSYAEIPTPVVDTTQSYTVAAWSSSTGSAAIRRS